MRHRRYNGDKSITPQISVRMSPANSEWGSRLLQKLGTATKIPIKTLWVQDHSGFTVFFAHSPINVFLDFDIDFISELPKWSFLNWHIISGSSAGLLLDAICDIILVKSAFV